MCRLHTEFLDAAIDDVEADNVVSVNLKWRVLFLIGVGTSTEVVLTPVLISSLREVLDSAVSETGNDEVDLAVGDVALLPLSEDHNVAVGDPGVHTITHGGECYTALKAGDGQILTLHIVIRRLDMSSMCEAVMGMLG